jgi:hypothetical protein
MGLLYLSIAYWADGFRGHDKMNAAEADGMARALLDALPSLVFVADRDVRIQEYNAAAVALIQAERETLLQRRAGDVLNCIHAKDADGGCGRGPACKDCVIRNAVTEAFHGNRVVRRRTRIEFLRGGEKLEIYALITASPFTFHGTAHALLVIEDISEIAELYRMIPVCSICKKVRDDKASWVKLETYFKKSWDVDFTHGICPACLAAEMAKLDAPDQDAPATPAGPPGAQPKTPDG